MKAVVTLTKNFFAQHPSLAGQPTHFADMVKDGRKIHTCRANFVYWMAKIDALKAVDGTLCLREWTGKPYRSPQGRIMEIPAEVVGVERLVLTKDNHETECYHATVDGREVDIAQLARNDGFTNPKDYTGFFTPLFDESKDGSIEMAIIHFTPFRYGSKES